MPLVRTNTTPTKTKQQPQWHLQNIFKVAVLHYLAVLKQSVLTQKHRTCVQSILCVHTY